MYMNQLTIIGFTGQDADFHFTPNRTPVATISVATKESWKNEQGEWQSRTEYHRVVAFGKLGATGFWSMVVFLGVLTVGFAYEWKKGALEWD